MYSRICQLSNRIIIGKLKGKLFIISNVLVYAPTAQRMEKVIQKILLHMGQHQNSMQIAGNYNCDGRPECQSSGGTR